MAYIIKLLLNALAFYLGAKFLKGVDVRDFTRAIIVAFVMGILNMTLGVVLEFVTLGLLWVFSFILNAILIMVADYLLKGFKVENFWWALGLAIFVSIVNSVTYGIFL